MFQFGNFQEENRKNKAKNKAARKKAQAPSGNKKDVPKQNKEDFSPSPNSELGTPLGNVKMRKKFFSELEDKDEAATIIQSRKIFF